MQTAAHGKLHKPLQPSFPFWLTPAEGQESLQVDFWELCTPTGNRVHQNTDFELGSAVQWEPAVCHVLPLPRPPSSGRNRSRKVSSLVACWGWRLCGGASGRSRSVLLTLDGGHWPVVEWAKGNKEQGPCSRSRRETFNTTVVVFPALGKRQRGAKEIAQDKPGECKSHNMVTDPCWMEEDQRSSNEMGILGWQGGTSGLTAGEKKKDAESNGEKGATRERQKTKGFETVIGNDIFGQSTDVSQMLNGTEAENPAMRSLTSIMIWRSRSV